MSIPHHSTNVDQLISYLQQGVSPAQAASALGITASAVSQLMASPEVSSQLAHLREEQAKRSTAIDEKYDRLENALLDRIEQTLPLLLRPEQQLNALTRINSAKRRGLSHIPTAPTQLNILQLNLPAAITQRFTTNANNQVVAVSGQELITMQSSNISKLAEAHHAPATPQLTKQSSQTFDEFGFPIGSTATSNA